MAAAIHDLPPTPRRVRWRAVLGHAWPLALAGILLTVYGGLVGLMFLFHRQGLLQREHDLDREAKHTEGRIKRVEPVAAGGSTEKVLFEYHSPGMALLEGTSFVASGRLHEGEKVEVEYLEHLPVARVAGGRITLAPDPLESHLRYVMAPGSLCLLLWLGLVLRLRSLLASGDVAVAAILAVRTVPIALPTMLRVHYSFRDHNAKLRTGSHWVRAHGPLAGTIASSPRQVVVVHDRSKPRVSRLVLPADFRSPNAAAPAIGEESLR